MHSRSSWWTCRKSNPRSLLAREARCPQHKPKSGTSTRTRTSTLTLKRRSSSLLSYGGKNGGSWMESNLVPGRDLVYSQTSGHRSLFAQPIDWYPMSGLNRLQQVCRTRHRPNGSGKYVLHARYLHRTPLGYTYPVVAVTSCRSPHEGLFWRLQRDSNSSLTGSTVRFHPRCRGFEMAAASGIEPDSDTLTAWRIALMLDGKTGAG